MKTFFTADLHLGHANIIKYCGRTLFMTPEDLQIYNTVKNESQEKQKKVKFSNKTLENMNKEIIRRWNERVKPEDIVYHIGDFCFRSANLRGNGLKVKADYWEKHLNGKIIFLMGTHDKNNGLKTKIHRIAIRINKHLINLTHAPINADVNYEINLTGHVHNNWEIKRIKIGCSFTDCINVGVDVWNFYPVTFEEIMRRYSQWKKERV